MRQTLSYGQIFVVPYEKSRVFFDGGLGIVACYKEKEPNTLSNNCCRTLGTFLLEAIRACSRVNYVLDMREYVDVPEEGCKFKKVLFFCARDGVPVCYTLEHTRYLSPVLRDVFAIHLVWESSVNCLTLFRLSGLVPPDVSWTVGDADDQGELEVGGHIVQQDLQDCKAAFLFD